jgi:virulence-associated protein VapD
MPKEIKRRYAINFDLSIKQLEEFYSKEHPRKAYAAIKRYMLEQLHLFS